MYGSGTLLADGKVWVSGGSTTGNVTTGAVYTSELWNPQTRTWTMTASAKKMRLYHSNALLLPDATVPGHQHLIVDFADQPDRVLLFNTDGTTVTDYAAGAAGWADVVEGCA